MAKRGRSHLLGLMVYSVAVVFTLLASPATAQKTAVVKPPKVDSVSKTIVAGHYHRSGFHNWLFGTHYREEWSTPVRVPVLRLDTLNGYGLMPYEADSSLQCKMLCLHDSDDREYVLLSLNRSYSRKLDPVYKRKFFKDLVDDQVSTAHPYAAVTIPPMADAAGIYHTNPRICYVPEQEGLDSFRQAYSNGVYLLEQRPDGNWETAVNFGNADKIVPTDTMLNELGKSSANRVDQLMYVRCRLFDMLIGDWGRNGDAWCWAETHTSIGTIFRPIPCNRDQAYSRFDGIASRRVLGVAEMHFLQSFNNNIHNVEQYNYTARLLDDRCTNEVTLDQWVDIAKELQDALTNNVIEEAIRRMPPEVFPMHGPDIIKKLESRRSHLVDWAQQYYYILSHQVDVQGSAANEYFDVRRLNDNETSVDVYPIEDSGVVNTTSLYHRVFKTSETQDIRLYGIAGNDKYTVSGKVEAGPFVRIIGGPDKDIIIDSSEVSRGKRKTIVYDDWDNTITSSPDTKLKLSADHPLVRIP